MGLAGRLTGIPPGRARRLAVATLIDWAGTGLWLSVSTVLMVKVVHLRPTQVGLGLTVGGLLGLGAVWPVTALTRRLPVRHVAITVQCLRGLFFLGYVLVHSAPAYYLVTALVAIADRPATSVNQVLVARYVPASERTGTLAAMHVATNAGVTLGALVGSIALVLPGRPSFDTVVVANSLSFAVAAWQLRRATAEPAVDEPAATPAPASEPAAERRRRGRAPGWRFVLVTVGCGLLALLFPLFNVEIPLWLTSRTRVPAVTVSGLFVLNTILVVLLQARVTRRARDVPGGRRAAAVAGAFVAASCGVLAGLPGLAVGAAAAGFVVAGVLVTLGELHQGSAAWSLSFGLSPPGEETGNLALFNTGQAAALVLGPALCTSLVAWTGRGGFGILAALLALGAGGAVAGSRGHRPVLAPAVGGCEPIPAENGG